MAFQELAYFPAYPAIVRVAADVLGALLRLPLHATFVLAALLVSTACFALGVATLYHLILEVGDIWLTAPPSLPPPVSARWLNHVHHWISLQRMRASRVPRRGWPPGHQRPSS